MPVFVSAVKSGKSHKSNQSNQLDKLDKPINHPNQPPKNKQRYQRSLMAIACCGLLSLLGGCSGTNWGNVLERRVSPITLQTKAELPADFPKIVPVYAPAKLIEIWRSPQPEQLTNQSQVDRANATIQVFSQWQTDASIDEVTSFYVQAFSDNDWQMLLMPQSAIGTIDLNSATPALTQLIQLIRATKPIAKSPPLIHSIQLTQLINLTQAINLTRASKAINQLVQRMFKPIQLVKLSNLGKQNKQTKQRKPIAVVLPSLPKKIIYC
jgi:hypothetical protein